jgi:PTH1 family peptidyl-tRNA hydrolase
MAQVVVGLGNPGSEHRSTRHNIGHWIIDRLAKRLRGRWERAGSAQLYESEWKGEPLYLAKLSTYMNVSGPAVARLLRHLHLASEALILIYDDIDLALGKVRVRQKGRHGGHKGVQSVLDSLGTQAIRRVKIGVGRPTTKEKVVDHVLTRFDHDELPEIEAACELAAESVLTLVEAGPVAHTEEE